MKIVNKATALLILLLFCGAAFAIFNSAQKSTAKLNENMRKQNEAMLSREYRKYEGTDLTGASVLSACRALKDKLNVTVVFLDGTSISYDHQSGIITNLPSDPNYISPSLKFISELEYDANESLIGIKYTALSEPEV